MWIGKESERHWQEESEEEKEKKNIQSKKIK